MLKKSLKTTWWSTPFEPAGSQAARRSAVTHIPTRIEHRLPPVEGMVDARDSAGSPAAQLVTVVPR
jgi:hypothetical protein